MEGPILQQTYRVPVREEDRIRTGLALHVAAASTGAPVSELTARGRRLGPLACRTRRLAVYLAHVTFGWPLERTAHAFGLNRSTASTACRWIEDARDRPEFDGRVDHMEGVLRAAVEAPRAEFPA